jgi:4-hydroxybenzoate polyprenyltransferase
MAVLTYLASAQGFVFPTLPKEPAAGILYAAGIWGGPIVMSEGSRFWLILAAAFHAIAAILNLTMLGVFEAEPDREQGARSLALRLGAKFTARMVLACGVVAGLASCLIAVLALSPATATTRPAPSSTPAAFLVLAAQILMPVFLLLAHSWSSRKERYRFWGDSIFYLGAFPRLL